MKKSGIYKIINSINGKIYIGSAVCIKERWRCHKKDLLKNKHHSQKLQRAYNKYGIDTFKWEIIEFIENKDDLIKREQFWLDNLLFANKNDIMFNNLGYNICRIAGSSLGRICSNETKTKIGIANSITYKYITIGF